MSNTVSVVTSVIAALGGSFGGVFATINRKLKSYEVLVHNVESDINHVIDLIDQLDAKITAVVPAPKPAASRAPVAKKATKPVTKKRLR